VMRRAGDSPPYQRSAARGGADKSWLYGSGSVIKIQAIMGESRTARKH